MVLIQGKYYVTPGWIYSFCQKFPCVEKKLKYRSNLAQKMKGRGNYFTHWNFVAVYLCCSWAYVLLVCATSTQYLRHPAREIPSVYYFTNIVFVFVTFWTFRVRLSYSGQLMIWFSIMRLCRHPLPLDNYLQIQTIFETVLKNCWASNM